jgi:hypothetical protein
MPSIASLHLPFLYITIGFLIPNSGAVRSNRAESIKKFPEMRPTLRTNRDESQKVGALQF